MSLKQMKTASQAVLCVALTVLLVSCGNRAAREDTIKKIIGKYNNAIALAYKTGNFNQVANIASGDALNMVSNTYQSYLNGMGIILDSELLELSVESIELGSKEDEPTIKIEWNEKEKEWKEVYKYKESFADTKEKWRYKWVKMKTGEIASPEVTVVYDMRYTINSKIYGRSRIVEAVIKKQEVLSSVGDASDWDINKGALPSNHGFETSR